MRLWLEVLKANMPVEPEPQQAVKMLDSEIDRLDRAVKTFLNFTKPLEFKLEETDLRMLLDEVLDAARPTIAKAGIELRVDLPSRISARAGGWPADSSSRAQSFAECERLHESRRHDRAQPAPQRRFRGHCRGRFRRGHLARKSEENFSAVFYHPARRYRHRTGEYFSVCAVAQRSDRIRIGAWTRHHLSPGIAAGAFPGSAGRESMRDFGQPFAEEKR